MHRRPPTAITMFQKGLFPAKFVRFPNYVLANVSSTDRALRTAIRVNLSSGTSKMKGPVVHGCRRRKVPACACARKLFVFVLRRRFAVPYPSSNLNATKSVLPLRLAKTGPLFHVVAFWSRFRVLLPLEKLALCVSDFRHELRELTTNSRFHNFGFQELSNKLCFRIEQSMSTPKPLRKLAIKNF